MTDARRPKVCIVQYNASAYLTRVDRAARALAGAGWEVVLVALQDAGTPAFEDRGDYVVKRVEIKMRRFTRRFGLKFLRFAEGVARTTAAAWREDADVYDARDAYPLLGAHLAARLRRAEVVYDADELATGRNWRVARNPVFARLIRWYEGFFARRSDAVITSDHGRADELERLYRIARPTVLLNVPEMMEHIEHDAGFRERALGDKRFLLIYQGVLIPNRGLHEMLDAMRSLSECRLAIVGYGAMEEELRARIAREGLAKSAEVFGAVPFETMMTWVAASDIGVIPLQNACLSYYTAAPNKLFECMMAGIPVVASDFPDMARVVREERVGSLIADPADPDSIAEAVRALLEAPEPLSAIGARAREAALKRYNWDREKPALLDVYSRLLPEGGSARA